MELHVYIHMDLSFIWIFVDGTYLIYIFTQTYVRVYIRAIYLSIYLSIWPQHVCLWYASLFIYLFIHPGAVRPKWTALRKVCPFDLATCLFKMKNKTYNAVTWNSHSVSCLEDLNLKSQRLLVE